MSDPAFDVYIRLNADDEGPREAFETRSPMGLDAAIDMAKTVLDAGAASVLIERFDEDQSDL